MSHVDPTLVIRTQQLLAAHDGPTPLLLPNAWDVGSAQAVAEAGFAAVATSSRAIAGVLNEHDDDTSDADVIFTFLDRIARSVEVPVTADLQAGFGLSPTELVQRVVSAGLAGCNLEDSDHHGDGVLVEPDQQATYLAAVRGAANDYGIHIVINARIDTFLRQFGNPSDRLHETIRRAEMYLAAGADCVFPMAVSKLDDARTLANEISGRVNLLARQGGPSIADLTAAGADRISFGSGIFNLLSRHLGEILAKLADGTDLDHL